MKRVSLITGSDLTYFNLCVCLVQSRSGNRGCHMWARWLDTRRAAQTRRLSGVDSRSPSRGGCRVSCSRRRGRRTRRDYNWRGAEQL